MTQSDEFSLERFAEMVSAYGGRPGNWPRAERARGRLLLETSPEARRLADEAAQVDLWLDEVGAPPVRAELEARILARAPAFLHTRPETAANAETVGAAGMLRRLAGRLRAGPKWVRQPVYSAAAAACFGLLVGWSGVFSQSIAAGEEEEIVAMAFVGGGLERYDLGEWQ